MLLIFLATAVFADIVPTPPKGKSFAAHWVEVQNLSAHPDYVLYVGNKGSTTSAYRVFDSSTKQPILLAKGGSRDRKITEPQFLLLRKADFETWKTKASAEVGKQKADCRNGIGCPHISRFVPSYPTPKGIDCKTSLTVKTTTTDSQSEFLNVYSLETANEKKCVLKAVNFSPSSAGCSTIQANPHWALLLLSYFYRREHKS
jgi:hypothetical protein